MRFGALACMLHLRSLIFLAAGCAAIAGSNSPDEFSQPRTMAHIRSLAALKSRTAGSGGEVRAIEYVRKELWGTGAEIQVEPFRFRSYDLKRAVLRVGGVSVQPARIVFDVYGGAASVSAEVAFVAASTVNVGNGVAGLDLSRRIVVTTNEFAVGTGTGLEVLDANLTLTAAETGVQNSLCQMIVAYLEVHRHIGDISEVALRIQK